jgi:cyclopropane fatty-acyl-phospholipid synthase-like methyltransferase
MATSFLNSRDTEVPKAKIEQERFVSVADPKSDPHVNGEYFQKHPTWHIEYSAWKAENIFRFLQEKKLAPKKVGEVGCGAGEVLKQLQLKMGSDVRFWGWDVAPPAIEMAKTRENERLKFALADFGTIETPQLDMLLALEVVDHVEDYLGFMRMLKSRAELKLFSFSLDISVQSAMRPGAFLQRRNVHNHLHHFSKETVLSVLEYTGFEILDWCYPPNLASASTLATLAKPVRVLSHAIAPDLTVRMFGGYSLLVLTR